MAVRWGAAAASKKPSAGATTPSSDKPNEDSSKSSAVLTGIAPPTLSAVGYSAASTPAAVPLPVDATIYDSGPSNTSSSSALNSNASPNRATEEASERVRRDMDKFLASKDPTEISLKATKVQKWYRGTHLKKKELARLRAEWDADMASHSTAATELKPVQLIQRTLRCARVFLVFYDPVKDRDRLSRLASLLSDGASSLKTSIVALLLNRTYFDPVTRTISKLCRLCFARVVGQQATTQKPTKALYTSGPELRFLLIYLEAKAYKLPDVPLPNAAPGETPATLSAKALDAVVSSFFTGNDAGTKLRWFYDAIRISLCRHLANSDANGPATKDSLYASALLQVVALVSAKSSLTNLCFGRVAESEHLNEQLVNLFGGVPLICSTVDSPSLERIRRDRILDRTVALLLDKSLEKQRDSILARLGPDGHLVLLGNLVSLYRSSPQPPSAGVATTMVGSVQHPDFLRALTALVTSCQTWLSTTSDSKTSKSSSTASPTKPSDNNVTTFHYLFGFIKYSGQQLEPSCATTSVYRRIVGQISWLWSAQALRMGFREVLESGSGISVGNRALAAMNLKDCCDLYIRVATLLKPHSSDIFQAVAFAVPNLLPRIWTFFGSFSNDRTTTPTSTSTSSSNTALSDAMQKLKPGSKKPTPSANEDLLPRQPSGPITTDETVKSVASKMSVLISAARSGDPGREPLMRILEIFCEATILLLLTLDDEEIYVRQSPFTLPDLAEISLFLNTFLFQIYMYNSPAVLPHQRLIDSAKKLLMLLHDRNDRRPFVREEDWIIKDTAMIAAFDPKKLKAGTFSGEVGRILASAAQLFRSGGGSGTSASADSSSGVIPAIPPAAALPSPTVILDNLPQTVPFEVRVSLLRDAIRAEQNALSTASFAPVKIRRNSILEDGYKHLGRMSPFQLKQRINIKFVNELGVDEIGIDQSGLFKEFLEQLCKRAFAADTGLFRAIEGTEMVFPNPASHLVHENDLSLFQFLGRILGKSLYEGIVIDIPFGLFFYAKMLNRFNTFDDLPSLDPDLYKQLTFIKHYQGDVEDLGLTFSFDEDLFGKIETREIKPGGAAIDVTSENKYAYIYLLADYHLNRKAKAQTEAFIKGFKSLVPDSWLRFFSPLELQRLLSGEGTDFDVADLRANTSYEGGYSDSHPTIRAMWEVVSSFDPEDRKKFLRFVTSCSRAPIGGFMYLNPKFTIRYIPDEAGGDMRPPNPLKVMGSYLGGVLGGAGKEMGRLPTSATCFNRLMLPAFPKKSTLKERLQYAIRSGAGFELS